MTVDWMYWRRAQRLLIDRLWATTNKLDGNDSASPIKCNLKLMKQKVGSFLKGCVFSKHGETRSQVDTQGIMGHQSYILVNIHSHYLPSSKIIKDMVKIKGTQSWVLHTAECEHMSKCCPVTANKKFEVQLLGRRGFVFVVSEWEGTPVFVLPSFLLFVYGVCNSNSHLRYHKNHFLGMTERAEGNSSFWFIRTSLTDMSISGIYYVLLNQLEKDAVTLMYIDIC